MGEGELLAVARALTLGLVVAAGAVAQDPVYRECWGYLHLEARRAELRRELAGRDAATHDKVAAMLCEADGGIPLAPVAKALAQLRSVDADAAFLLRCAVGAYVLPEVCDPEAKNEICRATNVSVFVPFAVPFPGALTFELEVKNAAAAVVWSTTLDNDTGERDVRQGRPTAVVPCGEFADGAYRLTVRTRIDGRAPREHDPVLGWTFHVLRGYQARAERGIQQAKALEPSLPAVDRAWVLGMQMQVERAYAGEAFAVASDGVADLQRLEKMLANVAAKRPVAEGLTGDAYLGLPVAGGPPLQCVLHRAAGDRAAGERLRPLVVFVDGTPTYDLTGNRPSAPATRDPRWLADELAEFGREQDWHVAFLESPGLGRDFAPALREALPLLGRLVATGEQKPLLVCSREAAAIVALKVGDFRALVRGLVLVGGGAMAAPALQANGNLPVRLCALRGSGEEALTRVIDYVVLQQARGDWRGDVAWLSPKRPAWPFGFALLRFEIAAFARTLFPE